VSISALSMISNGLESVGIPYEYGEWTSEVQYPYFVGSYQEAQPTNESGEHDTTFILEGFTRDSWLSLEEAKSKIEELFDPINGMIAIAEDKSAVAIFYGNGFNVPTGDSELKKIQINLIIKEFSKGR